MSLNMLRSRRRHPEDPVGASWPAPVEARAERLAFVLHDMFAMPFDEVGAVLGRSTGATRQLASRARRRVRGAPSVDHAAGLARQRDVATEFLASARLSAPA